jgi:hypothetical protein
MVQQDVAPEEAWFLPALWEELSNDPKGVGYATMDKHQAAEALNTVGLTGDIQEVTNTAASAIVGAIGAESLGELSDKDVNLLNLLLSGGSVNLWDATIVDTLNDIFKQDPGAVARILELRTRPTTRAAFLGWGQIGYWDVARAREES